MKLIQMKLKYILLSCLFCLSLNAQTEKSKDANYVYASTSLDDNSNGHKTIKERIAALQIPAEDLSKISTPELIEACLNFPYLIDMFLYDGYEQGFKVLCNEFNGFNELLSRKDISEAILNKYSEMLAAHSLLPKENNLEKGLLNIRSFVLLYVIGLDDIYGKMDEYQKEHFIELTKQAAERLDTEKDLYGTLASDAILQFNNSLAVQGPLKSVMSNSYATYNGGTYQCVTRNTPKGSVVYCGELVSSDYDSSTKWAMANQISLLYNVNIAGEATRHYNCHGYAWHMYDNNLNDPVVIYNGFFGSDDNGEAVYWNDGSFIQVTDQNLATRVSYDNRAHSAVRINNNLYKSKWGTNVLVTHQPSEVPSSYGSPSKFYQHATNIYGPKHFCDSATYTLRIFPEGGSVVWSASGEIAILSGQNTTSLTIEKTGNGFGNLTANIYYNGQVIRTCNYNDIVVGNPSLALMAYPVDAYGNMGSWTAFNTGNTFIIESAVNNAYSFYQAYLYKINGSSQTQVWHGTNLHNGFGIPYNMSEGWYAIKIRGYGDCGFSQWWTLEVQVFEDFSPNMELNYNSSQDMVTATININETDKQYSIATNNNEEKEEDYVVQLWNDAKLVKSFKTNHREFQIPMSGLKKGVYFVRVIIKGKTYAEKFAKN